ncbi:MAG TPA: hypothetical protein VGE00_08690 [Gammaproteobacteria bacterium]
MGDERQRHGWIVEMLERRDTDLVFSLLVYITPAVGTTLLYQAGEVMVEIHQGVWQHLVERALLQQVLRVLEMVGGCLVGEPDSTLLIQKQNGLSQQIKNRVQSVACRL